MEPLRPNELVRHLFRVIFRVRWNRGEYAFEGHDEFQRFHLQHTMDQEILKKIAFMTHMRRTVVKSLAGTPRLLKNRELATPLTEAEIAHVCLQCSARRQAYRLLLKEKRYKELTGMRMLMSLEAH